jgi:hypothetical protein
MGRFEPEIEKDERSSDGEEKKEERKKERQTDRQSGGAGAGAEVSGAYVPCGMRSCLRLCFELVASKVSLLAALLPSLVVPHSCAWPSTSTSSCLSCTQGVVPPARGDSAGGRRGGLFGMMTPLSVGTSRGMMRLMMHIVGAWLTMILARRDGSPAPPWRCMRQWCLGWVPKARNLASLRKSCWIRFHCGSGRRWGFFSPSVALHEDYLPKPLRKLGLVHFLRRSGFWSAARTESQAEFVGERRRAEAALTE